MSVDAPPDASEAVSFRNLFYSRVVDKPGFDAALRQMPRFYSDLRRARVGRIPSMYFWYLTCARCLIERGPERIILLARSEKQLAIEPGPLPFRQVKAEKPKELQEQAERAGRYPQRVAVANRRR